MKYVYVLGLVLLWFVSNATIIEVPTDQLTIQDGIDAASSGDTVLVASETYTGTGNRQISFGTKNIVLLSSAGPENTIIDCEGSLADPQYVFLINGQQDTTNVIEGFTITGGWNAAWSQAAITVNNSSLVMRNCHINDNDSLAIYFDGNSPDEDYLFLENCVLKNNTGSAIYGHYLEARITGCEFGYNTGDGLNIFQCHQLELRNSIFHNNTGSGLFFTQMGQNCLLENCTFVKNNTGIIFDWDYPKDDMQAEIKADYFDSSGMANCIVAFNNQYGVYVASPFTYYMNCNDVYGNLNSNWVGSTTWGPGDEFGTLSIDPRFCDTATADFTLESGSPCLPAHNGCGVLMGALDEGCVGPPPPAKHLVPSQYPTIQAAIDVCNEDDTVLVAADIYTGTGNRDLDFNGVNIILMSESGPEVTIIDCEGTETEPHRGLSLLSGEDTTSIINGFTFTNAYNSSWNDAALYIVGAGATVTNCIFENNHSNGMTSEDAAVIVSDCISRNNTGCGFEINYPFGDISHIEAYNNGLHGLLIDGGGEFIVDSSVMYNNGYSGMFIHYFSGQFYISNCTFAFNEIGLRYDWNYPKDADYEKLNSLSDTAFIDNCIAVFNSSYGFKSQYMIIPHIVRCSDAYGNGLDDWNVEYYDDLIYGSGDTYGNFSMDPWFCDTAANDYTLGDFSPCSPAISQCGLVGALEVGCQLPHDPKTWHVPGDRPTIQEAINVCTENDTVLVAPGTYTGYGNVDLRFLGYNIVLKSEGGPSVTKIDCEGTPSNQQQGILISNGEDTTSVIEGFTIINSYGRSSHSGAEAAVTIKNSAITLRNCLISTSYSHSILCENSTLNMYDCVIDSCTTNGVKLYNSNATIDNMIGTRLSHAIYWGRTVEYLKLSNSLMYNNRGFGVSISIYTGTFDISNCTFVNGLSGIYLNQLDKEDDAFPIAEGDTSYIENCISAYHEQYGYYTWEGMNHPVIVSCNDAFGNGYENWHLDEYGHGDAFGNLAVDPIFCDTALNVFTVETNSPCAPDNNSCGVLMGYGELGCNVCCVLRGDINHSGDGPDISDLVYLVTYMFSGGPPPSCSTAPGYYDETDVNGSGTGPDISDLVYLANHMFLGGPAPIPCP